MPIDVLPTVLTSAGADPVARQVAGRELDGVSLCGLLAGAEADFPERDWYSYHGQGGTDKETIAIKTAQWKLVVTGPDVRGDAVTDKHRVYLYKMPGDLLESQNLADRHPEVVQRLLKKLVAYRSLQPKNGVTTYNVGKEGFKPWKDWRVTPRRNSSLPP